MYHFIKNSCFPACDFILKAHNKLFRSLYRVTNVVGVKDDRHWYTELLLASMKGIVHLNR